MLDINERQKKAITYVNEKLRIIRREYVKINNASHTTTQKELKDLVDKKVIEKKSKKKQINLYSIHLEKTIFCDFIKQGVYILMTVFLLKTYG